MPLKMYTTDEVNEAWILLISYTQGVTLETHRRFKAYFNGRRKNNLDHTNALDLAKTMLNKDLPEVEFTLEGGP